MRKYSKGLLVISILCSIILTACGSKQSKFNFDNLTQGEKVELLVSLQKDSAYLPKMQDGAHFLEQPSKNSAFEIIGNSGETPDERKKYSNIRFKPLKSDRNFIGFCFENEGKTPDIGFQIISNQKLPLERDGYWAIVTTDGRLFGDKDNFKGRESGERFWVGDARNPISVKCESFKPAVLVVMLQTVDYWYEQFYILDSNRFSSGKENWIEYSIKGEWLYLPLGGLKEPFFWKFFF